MDKAPGAKTRLAILVSTLGGVGYLPWAPGTWASAASLLLVWALSSGPAEWRYLGLIIVVGLGAWSSLISDTHWNTQDNGRIVIDETAGILVTFLVAPFTGWTATLGFLLFRLFDITKPWPVRYFDRHYLHGYGVILDDLLAGVYAALSLELILWVL